MAACCDDFVACVLIYLAIVRKFEPLLLLPIAFGMLLVNLPLSGLMESLLPIPKQEACFIICIWGKRNIPISYIPWSRCNDGFGPLIANPSSLF